MEILRLKQSCFRIKISDNTIYTDPYKIPITAMHKSQADLILISHPHFDHCHSPSIKHIYKENSCIIIPSSGKKIRKNFKNTRVLLPGETTEFNGIKITAIHAYNNNKYFHRKKKNWVGYSVTDGTTSFYHAGDTDLVTEMDNLAGLNLDYAFIPISGRFVMDLYDAVKAVSVIKPKNIIPMHEINKSLQEFERLVKAETKNQDINIVILKEGEELIK
jgi:L-ascorbate metabolism protein UlaG (beta-lactamase superfamily)